MQLIFKPQAVFFYVEINRPYQPTFVIPAN